ncbi:hypothetical protein RND71_035138 [Anisodus tanguticus]|uniref:Uncharacterized protein n=1 Tax=Anisodus tanguticus TaxID=243964 RepID=A0AAE1UVK4_9SOLA|nr:hypothetical protein RND71_035138 [Anisodus tanguticus]
MYQQCIGPDLLSLGLDFGPRKSRNIRLLFLLHIQRDEEKGRRSKMIYRKWSLLTGPAAMVGAIVGTIAIANLLFVENSHFIYSFAYEGFGIEFYFNVRSRYVAALGGGNGLGLTESLLEMTQSKFLGLTCLYRFLDLRFWSFNEVNVMVYDDGGFYLDDWGRNWRLEFLVKKGVKVVFGSFG